MRRFFKNNGLSIVLFALFFLSLVGQYLTGFHEYNEDRKQHNQPTVGYVEYLGEGHFIEAVFENWESEFLQMGMYVVLTIFLYQKGSSESKEPGTIERSDVIPAGAKDKKDAPYPVRHGGLLLKIYSHSLSIALFSLFAMSFVLHAVGGAADIHVRLSAPPVVIYEVRETILDKLLGRGFFVLASAGRALSDNAERIVVPDNTTTSAAPTLAGLMKHIDAPVQNNSRRKAIIIETPDDEEETIVRR